MVTQTPPPVETLRSNLAALIEESQALRSDVKRDAAARRRDSLVNQMLSLIGILVIGVILVVAYQTNQNSKQTKRISDQIASCTTPQGDCYRDAGKRTSGTVQKLVTYNLYIQECVRSTKTDAELEECVKSKISKAP